MKLRHFAVHVQELIEVDLFPVHEPAIELVGIDAAEVEFRSRRIGPQQETCGIGLPAVFVEHFQLGIERRPHARAWVSKIHARRL